MQCTLLQAMQAQRLTSLMCLQVLFNTTNFAETGQVILHRGSRQDIHTAKRLFEDFFRLMEALDAKDEVL